MNTTSIIIAIVVLIIYWIFIRNGKLNQGIGKYMNKDYWGAIKDLNESILKNPKNPKAYFYLGLSYKQISETESRQAQNFKINAIENLIKASDVVPHDVKANNFVEFIIVSEQDETNRNVLISKAKEALLGRKTNLNKAYAWLYTNEVY